MIMDPFLKSDQEIRDFVNGCTFYGTGGGGEPDAGEEIIRRSVVEGTVIQSIQLDEIKDDQWACCAYYVGSIAPVSSQRQLELARLGLGRLGFEAMEIAFKELETFSGKSISVLVPTEIGGLNSATSVALAARVGVPVLDGDLAGRAIPESTQSLASIYDLPVRPMVMCDSGGNISIIKEAQNWPMIEKIGKAISVAGGGLTATVGKLMTGRELKKVAIQETLSRSLITGRMMRQGNGSMTAEELADSLSGWWLFEGTVREKKWEDREGYFYCELLLEGGGPYARRDFKIWIKNENHISWLDGSVYVTSPDLIVTVEAGTLRPVTNTHIQEGDILWVFGFPCSERYRVSKGVEVLGPSHFGFDYPYRPIKDVIKGDTHVHRKSFRDQRESEERK
jgi:uncharacterized protein